MHIVDLIENGDNQTNKQVLVISILEVCGIY